MCPHYGYSTRNETYHLICQFAFCYLVLASKTTSDYYFSDGPSYAPVSSHFYGGKGHPTFRYFSIVWVFKSTVYSKSRRPRSFISIIYIYIQVIYKIAALKYF